jgi:hypothetical protein
MGNLDADRLKIVNSSGFPFQIGVRREIERTVGTHGWKIAAEEHRWVHPETQESGFIDLVARHQDYVFLLAIECKRDREKSWIFLTPTGGNDAETRLSALWLLPASEDAGACGWETFPFEPRSPEAAYCVIPKQDERNPMIERYAADLLPAVEALGREVLTMRDYKTAGTSYVILPVIVTNAPLLRCCFDAGQVSMADGCIDGNGCTFEEVPMIRFRKSLPSHYPSGLGPNWDLPVANATNERSILIVNASHLAELLQHLNIRDQGYGMTIERMRKAYAKGS